MTAAIQDKQFNQEFHWFCYQIFWPDSEHQEMSEKYSAIGSRNCTVTGYPKFDDLLMSACRRSSNSTDSFHLIWAPHYSYQDNWLRFGAFWDVAEYLFASASENSGLKITLRPHPALLEKIRLEPDPRLSSFVYNWQALPNTVLSEEADYSQLFANADAMLTDGLSFISEYQLFDKPLLFYARSDSIGFNEAGNKLLDGVYRVHTQDELDKTLNLILNGSENPEVINARREISSAIRPYPGCAAKNIVECLYNKLISEVKS